MYKKVIHNTGWNRLEKTVIKTKGKITGGAVGKKRFMEETGLGHKGYVGLEMLGTGKSFLGRKKVPRKGPEMGRNLYPYIFHFLLFGIRG